MSSQIADLIRACRKCQRNRPEHSEPLMPLEFPERPWERIGTDLFHWHKLQRTYSESIIEQLKSFFARHGILEVVMSDNGPQYAAETFRQFADKYGFIHVTS